MLEYAKPKQKETSKDTVQRQEPQSVVRPNTTGIPDTMKARYEGLSGFSFDDVKIHYNSDKPKKLNALAFTQGSDVHIAPGQEKHLSHELGHVVQQKQGRVKPTINIGGMAVNDDPVLEREADMGVVQRQPMADNGQVIQREKITMEAAQEGLGNFPAWQGSEVLDLWDTEYEGNCHGYTIHQNMTTFIEYYDILEQLEPTSNVAIFCMNKQIAHSGILTGTQLIHLLMGIGVLKTEVGADGIMGYEKRFNLPTQRAQLGQYLERISEQYAFVDELKAVVSYGYENNILDDYELEYNTAFDNLEELGEVEEYEDYIILKETKSEIIGKIQRLLADKREEIETFRTERGY